MDTHFRVERALESAARMWEDDILPTLCKYIRIPNVSPHYDTRWNEKNDMAEAAKLLAQWAVAQRIPGANVEVVTLPGRTPVIFMIIDGTTTGNVLLYGHFDKQPGMKEKWRDGLGPWKPVRDGDRLYGRGGADDGYSTFAALAAIRLMREQGVPHPRCVVLIEGCEESGSYDLPPYINKFQEKIGEPDLVVCLDSGCSNYEQLWLTTSLRGVIGGVLRVDILEHEVHSGQTSQLMPNSFRIIRALLACVETPGTGLVRLRELRTSIPEDRVAEAMKVAEVMGERIITDMPWIPGMQFGSMKPHDRLLDRTWRPALTVTGMEGLPPIGEAGNVLLPYTAVKLSVRIPPNVDPEMATRVLKEVLEKDPPYSARVTFTPDHSSPGWNAPPTASWLKESVEEASLRAFGKPVMLTGIGGTIPFMEMLGRKFPEAQFMITGLLGPDSNAHGPNEYLHIPTAKRLTVAVAAVLADYAAL